MELVDASQGDPVVDTALLLTRFAMRRVYGDAYWDLALATEDPEDISTDYERVYFGYDGGAPSSTRSGSAVTAR